MRRPQNTLGSVTGPSAFTIFCLLPIKTTLYFTEISATLTLTASVNSIWTSGFLMWVRALAVDVRLFGIVDVNLGKMYVV